MADSVYDLLKRIDRKLDLLLPPRPRGLGRTESLSIKHEKRNGVMAHFIKNRQHMANVPTGKEITRQELVVRENGKEIFRGDVAFDPSTGVEQPPLPEFWAEVGAKVERSVTYFRNDGTASQPFSAAYEQKDEFTGPMVNPTDLGATEQIDETDSDERPTS